MTALEPSYDEDLCSDAAIADPCTHHRAPRDLGPAVWLRLACSSLDGMLAEMELVEYAVSTVHMQGFTRIFRPEKFCPDEASHDVVKGRGVEIVKAGLEVLAPAVEKLPSLSTGISMADAALFYVLLWGIDRLKLEAPDPLASRYRSLKMRPSATRVFTREGISLPAHEGRTKAS